MAEARSSQGQARMSKRYHEDQAEKEVRGKADHGNPDRRLRVLHGIERCSHNLTPTMDQIPIA